jgi:hypothetical protein
MYWNHRVVDLTEDNDGEPYFEIQEVYYNEAGEPCGYCDPCVGGSDLEEIQTQLTRFIDCLEHPVLKKSDFVGKLIDDDNNAEGEW